MKSFIRHIVILSAIIPATYLFLMGILLLSRFNSYDTIQKSIMLNSSCVLGVFGYLGLWSLLLEGIKKSIKKNIILLS